MLVALLLTLAEPIADPPAPPAMTMVCKGEVEPRLGQPGPFRDRAVAIDDGVTLKLDDKGVARLRVPDALVPSIHAGAVDGWWPARNLRVDKAEIAGTLGFNVFDKAHFIVDLGLEIMTLDSNLGRFVGRCERQ